MIYSQDLNPLLSKLHLKVAVGLLDENAMVAVLPITSSVILSIIQGIPVEQSCTNQLTVLFVDINGINCM